MSDRTIRIDPALTRIAPDAFVANTATVIGDVHLGPQASLWFGTVVRGDTEEIRIGARSNIQDNSVIHADPAFPTTIGEDVTVGHRAIVHGAKVGDRCMIGMGAIVMNGAEIGAESIIGAGAVVREGMIVPPGSLVLGVPGKVVRQLEEPQRQMLKMSAIHYVESGQAYKKAGFEK
jgi:carbonic anhydrase/acetyltransferase-like protein (isoleucine patch superfamily)